MKIPFYLKITIILLSAGALFSAVFLGYNSGYLKQTNEQIIQNPSQNQLVDEPDLSKFTLNPKLDKEVKVDLSLQKAFLFEKGQLVGEYSISSGKPETPTPTGKFRVILKQDLLYSKIAGCWLSFWVGFTDDGKYGFHETPICDAKREGEDKIGQPASLGCLRLKLGEAEKFYKWVEIETSIEIL